MHYDKLLDTPLLNPIKYYGNKNNNVCFLLSYISTNLHSPFVYLSINLPFPLRNLLSSPPPSPPPPNLLGKENGVVGGGIHILGLVEIITSLFCNPFIHEQKNKMTKQSDKL